ncbi:hypothetical protein [uncultured Duncaniella sp.]|uniref:hypothetical protein n=1 Tax=uncultured Duncaniella sp. TaxID=2768039 RepID=UPI0015A78E9F|nr:hypothetical protein [uncultured Duncaniella sp.]
MRDIKTEARAKYQDSCNTEFSSVGTALTAVKQLQALYREYLLDSLYQRHLIAEIEKKVLAVLEQYTFPIEPTITPKVESSRIFKESSEDVITIKINRPRISFSLIPGKTPDEVFPLLDNFLESVVAMCKTKYLKPGSSLLKIINSIVQRIDYTQPVDPAQAVINRTLEGLLKNFDIEVINDAKIGDEFGNFDYFELNPNKNITDQFITSPAVISHDNGRTEILIRGSLVYPEIDTYRHD